jgi:hypothetical protein
MGGLQQAVSQGRFTVVNVGNNAKVPDILHVSSIPPCFKGWAKVQFGGQKKEGGEGFNNVRLDDFMIWIPLKIRTAPP